MSELFTKCRITYSLNGYVVDVYANDVLLSTYYSAAKPTIRFNPITHEYIVSVYRRFETTVDRVEDESQ